mgnify:CR=1 FL=1
MLRQVKGGIPFCVNVLHLDGFVLARSGLHSSVNYRSVTLCGAASMIEGAEEKEASLKAFLEHFVKGRWDTLRPIRGGPQRWRRVKTSHRERPAVCVIQTFAT